MEITAYTQNQEGSHVEKQLRWTSSLAIGKYERMVLGFVACDVGLVYKLGDHVCLYSIANYAG